MKIEIAIKRVTRIMDTLRGAYNTEDKDALGLGIEALKHIKDQRFHPELGMFYLLPGETKE